MRQTLINKAIRILLVCLILGPYFPHAARAGPESTDPLQRANELLELSRNQNLTNHRLALQTAQEALSLFQSANDLVGIATSYAAIGQYHYAQNAMTESAQYLNSALQLWRQQRNLREEANALIMLGYLEGRKGDWLNGVSYLTQALNLLNEENDLAQMGRIASGMGYVFNQSGLPENGLTQYQRAKESFRQAKSYRYYTRAVLYTGYTYYLLKNYPAALAHTQEALEGFVNLGDLATALDIAESHENMGQVYIAMQQNEVALEHLQLVLPVYESAGNPGDAARVRAMIGQIHEQQGAVGRARASYLEAARTLHQIDDQVNEAAVRFALGRLEMRQGNYDAAEKYLKASIDNTEEIRRDLTSRVFAAAFSASVQDRYEAYVDCLMHKHNSKPSQGLEVVAFEASEQAKARSLAELLRDTQTKLSTGTDPHLVEQERTLRLAIREKVDQTITLLAKDYKKEDFDQLETSLTSLREQHHQIAEKMNSHPDQSKEAVSYSVQQIQDLILEDEKTMLLEYFLGQNASYVWAITHNSVKVFKLPEAAVITDAVRRVYDIVSAEPNADNDNRLNRATAELGEIVLGPLAGQLNASRVIVVADGALNYIPFQLLPAPAGNGKPLVANYEVVNVPSASILGQIRKEKQNRRPSNRILAAFGDPVFASNYAQFKNSTSSEMLATVKTENAAPWRRAWRDIELSADALDASIIQPLIYSKFELRNLRKIAGPSSLVARGFDASRKVLENTDLSKYAILHFATHGLLNPKSPELSGFFLSMVDAAGRPQDGFITMHDVYSLHAPVDLVVLSACRTGLGKDVRGEGLIGLTRGFMHAGASSVVASLWKVDDEATAELMKHFYTNMLQKGMPPAEALRAAQNTLRQNPQWQSPHFWAGFTLQGEFKQPIRLPVNLPATTIASPKVQITVALGFLMTLLAGIGWGYWCRRSKPSTYYTDSM